MLMNLERLGYSLHPKRRRAEVCVLLFILVTICLQYTLGMAISYSLMVVV